jgi:hypothetical protein
MNVGEQALPSFLQPVELSRRRMLAVPQKLDRFELIRPLSEVGWAGVNEGSQDAANRALAPARAF